MRRPVHRLQEKESSWTDCTGDRYAHIEKAQAAYKERPSIFGADALAWTYYKNNNLSEAQKYSREALRIPHKSGEIYYHASMIARATGKTNDAESYADKALRFDPLFSILFSK
jgi:tetratricopeptide (TPR) repeat protein